MPARLWAILVWLLGLGLSALDSNLANVALPAIARDLHVSSSAVIWVSNGAQIASAVCVLPMTAFSDAVGFKRIFQLGVLCLLVGSAIAFFSTSLPLLIAGRVLAGMANGCIFGMVGAFSRVAFPQRILGRGLALNSATVSLMAAAGPSAAAVVLSFAHWPWLFGLEAPVAAVTLALSWKFLPDSARRPHRWDIPSAILNCVMMSAFIIGLHGAAQAPLPVTAAWLGTAAVCTAFFVLRQLNATRPMLGIDLLRIPLVWVSVVTMVFCFSAQNLALVSIPFLLYRSGGAAHSLLLSAWPLGGLIMAPIAGRLADTVPVGLLGGAGMIIVCIGMVAVAIAPLDAAAWDLGWRIAVCGAGFGLFGPPNMRGIVASAPPHRAGAASGINASFRTLSQSTGSALVAVIFGIVAAGHATDYSIDVVLYVAAVLSAIGAAISFVRMRL